MLNVNKQCLLQMNFNFSIITNFIKAYFCINFNWDLYMICMHRQLFVVALLFTDVFLKLFPIEPWGSAKYSQGFCEKILSLMVN
jgi:hypothetical protein